jgi:hypothetical protein
MYKSPFPPGVMVGLLPATPVPATSAVTVWVNSATLPYTDQVPGLPAVVQTYPSKPVVWGSVFSTRSPTNHSPALGYAKVTALLALTVPGEEEVTPVKVVEVVPV